VRSWEAVEYLVRSIGPVGLDQQAEVHNLILLLGLERATTLANTLPELTPIAFIAHAQALVGEAALRYPFGADFAWYACDAADHVAMFVQFSRGPIPLSVLEHWEDIVPLEEALEALPERCHAVSDGPDTPATWLEPATRGLYLYDWGHHGHRGARFDQYQREVSPATPITLQEIPEPLRELVRLARFESLRFADHSRIDLEQLPAYVPAIPND
jgi:hypothetical protein